jgi:hypothetical protein
MLSTLPMAMLSLGVDFIERCLVSKGARWESPTPVETPGHVTHDHGCAMALPAKPARMRKLHFNRFGDSKDS